MKEITIGFVDSIANRVSTEAKMRGLTSSELVKYIVGTWIADQGQINPSAVLMHGITDDFMNSLHAAAKMHMKELAANGDLKCKNCTMPLSAADVEKGECSSCHAPIANKED